MVESLDFQQAYSASYGVKSCDIESDEICLSGLSSTYRLYVLSFLKT